MTITAPAWEYGYMSHSDGANYQFAMRTLETKSLT